MTDARIVASAAALIALLTAAGAVVAPASGSADAGPSSFSAASTGAKAAYLTLKELGYNVERSFDPLSAIGVVAAETVLVLSGEQAASDQDRRAFRRFLEDGGIALVTGAAGGLVDWVRPLNARSQRPSSRAPQVFRALMPSPMTRMAREITVTRVAEARMNPDRPIPLYGDSPDAPVVAFTDVGRGRLIWWAAPTPLTNRHIAAADNLQLLLNTVGAPSSRRVFWDEYYHGHERSFWSYIRGTPLAWIALQIGLIGAAALLTFSRQHGPVRPHAVDPRTSPMEFVEMLGALYRRAGCGSAVVAAAVTRFRRIAAAVCGLPPNAPDVDLARAAAARLHLETASVERLVEKAARVQGQAGLDDTEALDLIRRLQRLSADLYASRALAPSRRGWS